MIYGKKKYNRRQREIQHRLLLRVESAVNGGAAQPLCLIVQIDARSLVSALYTTLVAAICIVQPNLFCIMGGSSTFLF